MGEPEFLKGSKDILKHGGKLPHWQQDHVVVFATFRLADSLPASELAKLSEFKANWLRLHGGSWSHELQRRWRSQVAAELDRKLDAGHGSCRLRDPAVRAVVEEVICCGNGDYHRLHLAVVMPNHVHVLFSPESRKLEQVIQGWKSVSTRRIRSAGCDDWPGWRKNYHDRLIRDRAHFDRAMAYTRANPFKAGLRDDEYSLVVGS